MRTDIDGRRICKRGDQMSPMQTGKYSMDPQREEHR